MTIPRDIHVVLLALFSVLFNTPLFAQPDIDTGVIEEESIEKEEKFRKMIAKEKGKPPEITYERPEIQKITPNGPAEKSLIKRIVVIGATLLSEREIRGVVSSYENKELSLKEMQKVADLITDTYHEKGYITSHAYIPIQKIEQGILEIRVIEGNTGEIEIKGNRYFKTSLLRKKITLKKGEPFNINILRKNLSTINEHPDRNVRAVLQPGKKPGTTDIIIDVEDHLPLHIKPEWDTYGSRYILRNRYKAILIHNNLMGWDDVLNIKCQLGEAGKHKLVKMDYLLPITEDLRIGFNVIHKRDHYAKEYKDLDMGQRARKYSIYASRALINQKKFELGFTLGFDYKDTFNLKSGNKLSSDRLRIVKIGLDLDKFNRSGRTILISETNFGIPDIMGGLKEEDDHASCDGSGGKFLKTNLTLARLQRVFFDSYFLFKSQFQFSSDILPGGEKFKLGGIVNVRGYPRAEAVGDTGYAITLGFAFPPHFIPREVNVPFSKAKIYQALKLLIFYDWANARLTSPKAGEDKSETLRSIGCGFRFTLPEGFVARTDFGWALGNTPSDGRHFHSWIKVFKTF